MPRSSKNSPDGSGSGKAEDLLISSSLPGWVIRTLAQSGVKSFSQLSKLNDEQLLELRGVGQQSVALIRTAVNRHIRQQRASSKR